MKLGEALEQGNMERVTVLRSDIEAIFGENDFEYRLLHVTVDPLRYWTTHQYDDVRIVAQFSSAP